MKIFFRVHVGGDTCLGTCSHESGMVPLPLGRSPVMEKFKYFCTRKSAFQFILTDHRKK